MKYRTTVIRYPIFGTSQVSDKWPSVFAMGRHYVETKHASMISSIQYTMPVNLNDEPSFQSIWDVEGTIFLPGMPVDHTKKSCEHTDGIIYVNPQSIEVREDKCVVVQAVSGTIPATLLITGTRATKSSKTPYLDDALSLFYNGDVSQTDYVQFSYPHRGYIRNHQLSLMQEPSVISPKSRKYESSIELEILPSDIIVDPLKFDNSVVGQMGLPGYTSIDGNLALVFRRSSDDGVIITNSTFIQLINAARADLS